MGLIVAPLPKPEVELVARNMNRLFNLFLPEIKRIIKTNRPECIFVEDMDALCLFYSLQGEIASLKKSKAIETKNAEVDFWQPEKITVWTTETWLFLLALEFQDSGKTQMVNGLMEEFFPKIFESSIIFGREAITMLKRIEAKLPSGRQIPEEAEELLMLV